MKMEIKMHCSTKHDTYLHLIPENGTDKEILEEFTGKPERVKIKYDYVSVIRDLFERKGG